MPYAGLVGLLEGGMRSERSARWWSSSLAVRAAAHRGRSSNFDKGNCGYGNSNCKCLNCSNIRRIAP
jgi:hypothetical protein